ncbi:MAG: ribosomal RNA small subunit methyltransferase A [Clostridia bacterium]|nr:ribosomal RNA small subunit methyltransferase A [Clostridia bacterium]
MEMKMKDLLQATSFRFNKALGQNFISDTNLLKGIVSDSGVTENDVVVEIGTGAGTLTRQIAGVAKKVYSFEVDKNLEPVHQLSLQGVDNVEVIFRDVLKMKDNELQEIIGTGEFKVVANLPYYITTPLIMRFLESDLPVTSLTIMVQEEVGLRLVAKPNTADYSAITLAVLLRGSAAITRKVNRNMFYPAPNVDSAVVRIDIDRNKLANENKPLIHKLVRSAFAMRRKTLVNNLNASFGISKQEAAERLNRAGLDEIVRGEALSLDDYIRLSKEF